MELGDIPANKKVVLKEEFDDLKYRVHELEEELRRLREYIDEATMLK